jgi:hypothetical protein
VLDLLDTHCRGFIARSPFNVLGIAPTREETSTSRLGLASDV